MSDHPSLLSSTKALSLRIKQPLSPLNLFFLLQELCLLSFGLFPVFVSNLSKDPSMCFGPLIFVFLELLLMFFNPLLDNLFPLLNQRLLKPLFEFHVTYLLLLLPLEPFFLGLLNRDQLLVLDMLFLSMLPFEHGMGALLHGHCGFFLFDQQGFE